MHPTPEEKLIVLVNEIRANNYKNGLSKGLSILEKIYFWIDSGATSYDLKKWVVKEINKFKEEIKEL